MAVMTQEALDQFIAKIAAMPTDKKVKLYVKAREAKAALARQFALEEAQFKVIMETAENFMLQDADKAGVTGFKTEYGTTYTAETAKITIADEQQFYDFVLQAKDLNFFEKRVSSKHVEEFMKNNPSVGSPPGLSLFRERQMRVRKASEK
jgi:hypothetical protein